MTVREIIERINIFEVKLTFDPREEVMRKFMDGVIDSLVFFSCVEGKERKKYDRLQNKSDFVSHSATIHIPDLTIDEIIDSFQCDSTGIYETIEQTIAPYLQDDIPKNVVFVCFLFLHEVGHWMQFKKLDCNVQKYSERSYELYKENYEKGNLIWAGREERLKRGITCKLTAREKEALMQCQNEYRQIPPEKDADEFAAQHLLQVLDVYRKSM